MKIRRKLFVLLLALGMIVTGVLVGCGGNNSTAVTYTVTVLLDNGTPASDVSIDISKGSSTFDTLTTGKNGKISVRLAPDTYTIALFNLPEGYEVPEGADLTLRADKTELTVTLAQTFAYKVTLVNEDGSPFYYAGVQVGGCQLNGNCLQLVSLGQNGVALLPYPKDNYHVQIRLPEGCDYTYDKDDHGYYTGKNFSPTETEMTIVMRPATALTFEDNALMSAAQKTEFTKKNENYTAALYNHPTQQVNVTLKKDEMANYAISSSVSGHFRLFAVHNADAQFSVGDTAIHTPEYGYGIYVEAGKTQYFRVTANADTTAEFAVTAPIAAYIDARGTNPTVSITLLQSDARGVIAFTPSQAGVYKATTQGQAHTLVEAALSAASDTVTDKDTSAYKTGNSAHIALTPQIADGKLYFAVSADGISFPATVSVKIERTAAVVTQTATVAESLEAYGDQSGTLTPVPLNVDSSVVKGTDGKYHFGSATGPVVVVLLTKAMDAARFENSPALAYMEMTNGRLASYVVDVTPDADKADPAKDHTFIDYRLFLRGFTDYVYNPNDRENPLSIPKNILTETYYAKYVNSDGTYPLTDELKTFLEHFYAANKSTFDYNIGNPAANGWLFPCYYYAQNA